MKNPYNILILIGLSTLVVTSLPQAAHAKVRLHGLFSKDMVLQREKPIPIWGTASPGERVMVQVGTQSKSALAGDDGAWHVTLDAMPAGTSTSFKVSGENTIELKNVAIGDVWICSGQSNMEWRVVSSNNAKEEIAAANYPQIRLLTVPSQIAAHPQKEFRRQADWQVCTPESVGSFSAVGYFYGRELHQKLNVPIGLINSSVGGSIAEAWTSREALTKLGEPYVGDLARLDALVAEREKEPFEQVMAKWWQHNDAGARENWQNPDFDAKDWPVQQLPSAIEAVAPEFDGIVWYRREMTIPEAWAGKELLLRLGNVDDQDTTYFNGTLIGATTRRAGRKYIIPAPQVKAGRAVLAVRVRDVGGAGGILGTPSVPEDFRLQLSADPAQRIPLSGTWQYKLSTSHEKLTPTPQTWEGNQHQTSVLFNGMIAPLVPFASRGVIWYQGESNTRKATAYRTLFPALMRDWRAQWNAKQDGSEFGFYFVQLANFKQRVEQPIESRWAELREAQTMTLSTPRTGMATAIDIGVADDVHPTNKQDVGKRLALVALAKEYGRQIEYSGPVFKAMKVEGNKARLEFAHAAGLKTNDGKPPRTFAIQGEDKKWRHAQARIDGENILVWNDEVHQPVAVRYAWANNPDVNLVNAAELPAIPFRTDAQN